MQLCSQVKILTWIMTTPVNHPLHAKAIKETWGKSSDILYFVSNAQDDNLPIVVIDAEDTRTNLWRKQM